MTVMPAFEEPEEEPVDILHGKLLSLLSMFPEALVITDMQGRVFTLNRRAREVFRVKKSRIGGTNMKSLCTRSDYLIGQAKANRGISNVSVESIGTPMPIPLAASVAPAQISESTVALVFSFAMQGNEPPAALTQRESARNDGQRLYGTNRAYLEALRVANSVPADKSTLIIGESGTGKSSFAHLIHERTRPGKPLVVCNCAGLSLIDPVIHLFGAFHNGKITKGLIEMASGGTLLLEHIEQLHPSLQPLFLRSCDHHEIVRDADFKCIHVDFRIIATASNEIYSQLEDGRLQPSLYYRLAESEIALPSCEERADDLAYLIERIIGEYCSEQNRPSIACSKSALNAMVNYRWPGNIREMRTVLSSACDICRFNCIELSDLPSTFSSIPGMQPLSFARIASTPSMAESRQQRIGEALSLAGNDVTEAARILGMGRSTLYKYLKQHRNV